MYSGHRPAAALSTDEIYGATSSVLHGAPSSQARARYRQVLRLAREVFVPLPDAPRKFWS
ncbi:hypothetical protein [Streptomyces sp. NPDC002324]